MDWKKLDEIKRILYGKLREETSFDYSKVDFKEYRRRFEQIPEILWKEWLSFEEENKEHPDIRRFKGPLYEALFYYACLDAQAIFFDAKLMEFGGEKFEQSPPWFVAIPIYDIIPRLHQVLKNGKWKRKVPQVDADFIISYVDDEGPKPPALIDVKSHEPVYTRRFGWQNVAAMQMGFIFQVAYPKRGGIPRKLEDWETPTPCPNCKRLSTTWQSCSFCGKEIFPFTIVDARYRLKDLIEKLGYSYQGRF